MLSSVSVTQFDGSLQAEGASQVDIEHFEKMLPKLVSVQVSLQLFTSHFWCVYIIISLLQLLDF